MVDVFQSEEEAINFVLKNIPAKEIDPFNHDYLLKTFKDNLISGLEKFKIGDHSFSIRKIDRTIYIDKILLKCAEELLIRSFTKSFKGETIDYETLKSTIITDNPELFGSGNNIFFEERFENALKFVLEIYVTAVEGKIYYKLKKKKQPSNPSQVNQEARTKTNQILRNSFENSKSDHISLKEIFDFLIAKHIDTVYDLLNPVLKSMVVSVEHKDIPNEYHLTLKEKMDLKKESRITNESTNQVNGNGLEINSQKEATSFESLLRFDFGEKRN
jgi:hypothetical protein